MKAWLKFTGTLLDGAHVRAEVGPEHIPLAGRIASAHAADQYHVPDRDSLRAVGALISSWDLVNDAGPIGLSPHVLTDVLPANFAIVVYLTWALATLEVRPTRIDLN